MPIAMRASFPDLVEAKKAPKKRSRKKAAKKNVARAVARSTRLDSETKGRA